MHHFKARPGVLLLDVLIGIAVFAILVGMVVFAMLFSQRGVLSSGDRVRAAYLSERALEAVRSVRDGEFGNLTAGTFGATTSEGTWSLEENTVTTTDDGFSTSVTVAEIDDDSFRATAETTWNFGQNRSGSVLLATEVTDWRTAKPLGNWATILLDGYYQDSETPPMFNDAVANEQYAFVASEGEDNVGLYIFDISNTAAPVRINTSFSIGADVYDLLLEGDNLFLLMDESNPEIRVLDVSSPTTLTMANQVGSVNLPGSGRGKEMDILGDYLFTVLRTGDLRSYNVSDINSIDSLDVLSDSDSMNDISTINNYAYIASSVDTFELRVADVTNPSDLQFISGGGYNFTDISDGTAVKAYDNYLLVGRSEGDVIDEIILFDITGGKDPADPPGPWYAEAGASVNALEIDPSETYGFVATDHDSKEMIIVDLDLFSGGEPAEITHFDTDTGAGRGVNYSIFHDRVFLLTNTAFIILKPGS